MSKMFEKAIKAFLDDKAEKDPAFAEKYGSDKKNIQDCCKFIIAEVKKSCKGNEAACTDQYVYGLAMHYYDEENIKVPANAPSCRIVVPGSAEPSGESGAGAENKSKSDAGKKERKQPQPSREPEFVGTLFDFAGEDRL